MKIKTLLFSAILIQAILLSAQNKSAINGINALVYKQDTSKVQLDCLEFYMDTIYVVAKYNKSKITTENCYTNTGYLFKINFYFKNDDLCFIRTSQKSVYDPRWECISEYYFSKGKMIKQRYRSQGQFQCVGYTLEDLAKLSTCALQLELSFLKAHLTKIQQKINPL